VSRPKSIFTFWPLAVSMARPAQVHAPERSSGVFPERRHVDEIDSAVAVEIERHDVQVRELDGARPRAEHASHAERLGGTEAVGLPLGGVEENSVARAVEAGLRDEHVGQGVRIDVEKVARVFVHRMWRARRDFADALVEALVAREVGDAPPPFGRERSDVAVAEGHRR
jgi:hypothetical protein